MSFRSRLSLPNTGERQMYSRSIDLDFSNTENQYNQGSDQKLRPRHSGTQGIERLQVIAPPCYLSISIDRWMDCSCTWLHLRLRDRERH